MSTKQVRVRDGRKEFLWRGLWRDWDEPLVLEDPRMLDRVPKDQRIVYRIARDRQVERVDNQEALGYAECPECHRPIRLTRYGFLRSHSDLDGEPCPGSWAKMVEA